MSINSVFFTLASQLSISSFCYELTFSSPYPDCFVAPAWGQQRPRRAPADEPTTRVRVCAQFLNQGQSLLHIWAVRMFLSYCHSRVSPYCLLPVTVNWYEISQLTNGNRNRSNPHKLHRYCPKPQESVSRNIFFFNKRNVFAPKNKVQKFTKTTSSEMPPSLLGLFTRCIVGPFCFLIVFLFCFVFCPW